MTTFLLGAPPMTYSSTTNCPHYPPPYKDAIVARAAYSDADASEQSTFELAAIPINAQKKGFAEFLIF